jgi:hypothetical protein
VPRGVVNKDQFEDLDSRGYPKPIASMLNGESMPVNFLTFHIVVSIYSSVVFLTTVVPCIL